jgi:hypothetical protein
MLTTHNHSYFSETSSISLDASASETTLIISWDDLFESIYTSDFEEERKKIRVVDKIKNFFQFNKRRLTFRRFGRF